jgi:hypothetical protein
MNNQPEKRGMSAVAAVVPLIVTSAPAVAAEELDEVVISAVADTLNLRE